MDKEMDDIKKRLKDKNFTDVEITMITTYYLLCKSILSNHIVNKEIIETSLNGLFKKR